MPDGMCFLVVASRHVDSRGRFELREKVTLNFPVRPIFQLKADYGCANDDDDSESVDIPRDYVTIASESTEQPIESHVWTHNFNYDS
ncbi:hypothetical protein AAVH_25516 [Aphelenchoides avenae]|nr:hypothetical protein AAVH_25516 [Aphelenchus avenae]